VVEDAKDADDPESTANAEDSVGRMELFHHGENHRHEQNGEVEQIPPDAPVALLIGVYLQRQQTGSFFITNNNNNNNHLTAVCPGQPG